MIVLLVLIVLALVVLYVRFRVRKPKPLTTARDFYEAQEELTKSGEHARKDYMKKHPRPPWDGSKSGEGK